MCLVFCLTWKFSYLGAIYKCYFEYLYRFHLVDCFRISYIRAHYGNKHSQQFYWCQIPIVFFVYFFFCSCLNYFVFIVVAVVSVVVIQINVLFRRFFFSLVYVFFLYAIKFICERIHIKLLYITFTIRTLDGCCHVIFLHACTTRKTKIAPKDVLFRDVDSERERKTLTHIY